MNCCVGRKKIWLFLLFFTRNDFGKVAKFEKTKFEICGDKVRTYFKMAKYKYEVLFLNFELCHFKRCHLK